MSENNFFHNLGDFFAGHGWNSKQRKKSFFRQNQRSHQLQQGQVYINTSVPYELVNSIPELSIPMRRLSAMFANGVFMLENESTGKRSPLPPDLKKLFKKLNPSQSQNEWLKQYLMQLQAFGNQYIYVNKPSDLSNVPTTLVNMNPSCIKPILTGKFYKQIDLKGIIKHYKYTEDGVEDTIETEDIIWSKIGDLNSSIEGKSLIASLQFPISNTELNYKYLNKLSGASGALGILSNKKKDSIGSTPLTDPEQKGFDNGFTNKYGVEDDQGSILVTSADVEFTFTTPETKKMLLIEQNDKNFITILNALGCNQNIFINSTYENMKHGLVSTQNDTIQPYADGLTQGLTESKKMGVPKGERIILDYSHLPYMQADKEIESKTLLSVSTSLEKLVTSGIINPVEAKVRLENQFGKV